MFHSSIPHPSSLYGPSGNNLYAKFLFSLEMRTWKEVGEVPHTEFVSASKRAHFDASKLPSTRPSFISCLSLLLHLSSFLSTDKHRYVLATIQLQSPLFFSSHGLPSLFFSTRQQTHCRPSRFRKCARSRRFSAWRS